MLLFYPFRNEVTEVHKYEEIVRKYADLKAEVDGEERKFDPNPDFMEVIENFENFDP